MATHSGILAWKNQWTQEPGGLQSEGSKSRTRLSKQAEPVKKENGKGWRLVQEMKAINNTVIPAHPVVPNPHTFFSAIQADSGYFS